MAQFSFFSSFPPPPFPFFFFPGRRRGKARSLSLFFSPILHPFPFFSSQELEKKKATSPLFSSHPSYFLLPFLRATCDEKTPSSFFPFSVLFLDLPLFFLGSRCKQEKTWTSFSSLFSFFCFLFFLPPLRGGG